MQDGPIHDAQWSPDGAFFVVVAGFMPAKTVLFDAKCKPVFDLGTGPYNIIKWNPQVAWSVGVSLTPYTYIPYLLWSCAITVSPFLLICMLEE